VSGYSSAKILRAADIEMVVVDLALKDVDVRELIHLPWGTAIFVLHYAAVEINSLARWVVP
jgi:hypothetical protein